MDISKYGKHGSSILIYLLNNGNVPITDFSKINIGPTTYYRSLSHLEQDGLIRRKETINRRKIVLVSLTEKGRTFAKKLVDLEKVSEATPQADNRESISMEITGEENKVIGNMHILYHVNVLDDHITVEELMPDKPSRIFNIYIKQNGNGIFSLWCEFDNSYTCWHVHEALRYPQVQKMMTQYRVKVCPVCGFENPERAKFCMDCGAKLK